MSVPAAESTFDAAPLAGEYGGDGTDVTYTLAQYTYLQLLDLLTTLAFLLQGVQEANPVVRWAMERSPNPVVGLVLVKACALLLGVYCWRADRPGLLQRINVMFALLVAWNLVALILGSANR